MGKKIFCVEFNIFNTLRAQKCKNVENVEFNIFNCVENVENVEFNTNLLVLTENQSKGSVGGL